MNPHGGRGALFTSWDDVDPTRYDAIAIGAGPGGFDEANRLLGAPLRILGVDTSRDACATAVAAGHDRVMIDLRDLTPERMAPFAGAIFTPPCPTFSAAGRRSGHEDFDALFDSLTDAGFIGCGDDCEGWRAIDSTVGDQRTALVAHCLRLLLHTRTLQWFAAEQVPAVAWLWEETMGELTAGNVDWAALEDDPDLEFDWEAPHDFGWASCDTAVLQATDYGALSRRRRAFMWGTHNEVTNGPALATAAPLRVTMAEALGWPAGERVRTRGNRRATGGNTFSADGPSWCLTGKARSWERDSDGLRLTAGQAGMLNGFPPDYPWQGSRTSQFQQIGDVVNPLVGAHVLGGLLGMGEDDITSRIAGATATYLPCAAA